MTSTLKPLFLHFGFAPRALALAQSAVYFGRAAFAQAGWLYPRSGQVAYGHQPLIWELQKHPALAPKTSVWAALLSELEQSPLPYTLLSSAYFAVLQPPQIWQLAERLRHWDVQICIQLAPQDIYAQEVWLNTAQTGWSCEPFAQWLARWQATGALDYAARLQAWEQTFGQAKLHLQVIERTQRPLMILTAFLAGLGFPQPERLHRFLPSPLIVDYKALAAVQHLAAALPQRRSVRHFTYQKLFATFQAQAGQQGWTKKTAQVVDDALRQELQERYAAGNRVLAQRYCSRDRLFDADLPTPPLTPLNIEQIGKERALNLLTRLIHTLAQTVEPPQ